ncbi:DNA-binding protein [Paraburkholderia bonniea]|uniref:DNA-binding protein n=1 Tax=Paraburkholderia bonniea TaxID=2152891 RepID=UPI002572FF50|nr:DNA-binding protein [Paraburkholderia bonniea]WJF90207.1 DNA-binding protein [Paraburkholderia bonniea]WJF93521.1 DNA-binding protein [Paraburkholderia bonniea]
MQALLTVDQLAEHLQKSAASIRSDATRNPQSLPPICRLPNTKRLLWRVEDVEQWIARYVAGAEFSNTTEQPQPEKRRRGRPTKTESVAKQRMRINARE